MEIGLANEEKGISYFDLVEQVQTSLGFKFGKQSELTFLIWFGNNFSKSEKRLNHEDYSNFKWLQELRSSGVLDASLKQRADTVKSRLSFKYWLDGLAAKQYLDYVELQESRKAAIQARKQSNKSIWIAIGAIIVSSALGLYSLYNTSEPPQPPFEVKVIEDKTNTKQLQKRVDSLKNEIYEAQMIIDSYETDLSSIN